MKSGFDAAESRGWRGLTAALNGARRRENCSNMPHLPGHRNWQGHNQHAVSEEKLFLMPAAAMRGEALVFQLSLCPVRRG